MDDQNYRIYAECDQNHSKPSFATATSIFELYFLSIVIKNLVINHYLVINTHYDVDEMPQSNQTHDTINPEGPIMDYSW